MTNEAGAGRVGLLDRVAALVMTVVWARRTGRGNDGGHGAANGGGGAVTAALALSSAG